VSPRIPFIGLLALAACAPPDPSEAFTTFRVDALEPADAHAKFVDAIDDADDTLDVALPTIEDTMLSDALIAAHQRGVAVRAMTDWDNRELPGVIAMQEAGVPLTLADDGITYFDFNTNTDVQWGSDRTIMSDAWVLSDGKRGVVSSTAGSLVPGTRVVFDITGEDVLIDIEREHNQVFGGSDATSTTAYDNLAKSITDGNWSYTTSTDQVLEVWFGPQERLSKRIIDAVYTAKSSVRVLTDDFANEGLTDALQDKAELGFDVDVVVGPNYGASASLLSEEFRTGTPDVEKFRVCGTLEVPTVVLIDYDPARNDKRYTARAFVLSHDIYSATRLYRNEEITSDQFIDGTLLVVNDYDEPSGEMNDLSEVYETHRDVAVGGVACP